jgi:hypothetical protein
MMNGKGFGRECRYYAGICLEGLRKTKKKSISIVGHRAEI